jgi:hypothetical protein
VPVIPSDERRPCRKRIQDAAIDRLRITIQHGMAAVNGAISGSGPQLRYKIALLRGTRDHRDQLKSPEQFVHCVHINALPFGGVGAAEPAERLYTMSLRRPHPLQRLNGRPFVR